ncbi:MAG: peroxiredoxin [Gammaproteobacteria bacterium]|nr:peroxiredoxin [Gammaproteobacteria bacterium]
MRAISLTAAIMAMLFSLTVQAAPAEGPSEGPSEGKLAPDFRLQDQNSEWHSLSDYEGQWVVLYFYPKDDTPGCTTEACNFRDEIYRYRDMGAAVLGVSLDDVESHAEFAEKYELPFPLLADTEKKVSEKYDVLTSLGPITYASRQTFLINPEGVIVKHYEDVDPEVHAKEVLAELEKHQAPADEG